MFLNPIGCPWPHMKRKSYTEQENQIACYSELECALKPREPAAQSAI
jgi:hypothetical protein